MKKELKKEKEVKEVKEEKEEVKVDKQNPGFDPDIPEQKQRWFR